jgi:hypothetical protein
MMTNELKGHGTFLHDLRDAIERHGSLFQLTQTARKCRLNHIWIRVHGRRDQYGDEVLNREAIKAFQEAGMSVAGWGWCQGERIEYEADLAVAATQKYDLNAYVADIEHGAYHAHWTSDEVETFLSRVRAALGRDAGLAMSTYGLIDWHAPHLVKAADPLVDAFAPQVYWFDFPNSAMIRNFGDGYRRQNPAEYARLCIDRWRELTDKPLVITGQAYWKEGGMTRDEAEDKVLAFLENFDQYHRLAGLNWWHFGGPAQMSDWMIEAIINSNPAARF